MKKLLIICCVFYFLSASLVHAAPKTYVKCPRVSDIVETTAQDKQGLLNALRTIVPQIYTDEKYSEWQVTLAEPMPKLTGFDKGYYGMAKNFCGKEVANHTWLVKLLFPKLLPSASVSQGQIYLVKDKEKGWSVWFRYH
jgi:hypothetical protein